MHCKGARPVRSAEDGALWAPPAGQAPALPAPLTCQSRIRQRAERFRQNGSRVVFQEILAAIRFHLMLYGRANEEGDRSQ